MEELQARSVRSWFSEVRGFGFVKCERQHSRTQHTSERCLQPSWRAVLAAGMCWALP